METRKKIDRFLLQSKAIKLSPANPFTWASGWKSPIYCDNRKILSFPEIRDFIRDSFCELIHQLYPDTEVIAGVATGAIAHGAIVADKMNLPFVYVRSEAKNHGLANLVEGVILPDQRVVVIEDLVSTGGSSIKAVEALRNMGAKVSGMIAIFSYGFPLAAKNFQAAGCVLDTLTDYNSLVETAIETGYISNSEVNMLMNWRTDPENWNK